MIETALLWGVAVLSFALSVFCSVADGAIYFHSPARLEANAQLRQRLSTYAGKLERFLFSAKLITIACDVVLVALIGSAVMHRALMGVEEAVLSGDAVRVEEVARALSLGPVFVAVLLATLAVLLFAEILPRALAEAYADRLLPKVLGPMAIVDRIFAPFLFPLHALHTALSRLAGGRATEERITEEIRSVTLEAEREGVIDGDDASMIQSIIEFRESEVRAIMTPRTEMVCVEVNARFDEVMDAIVEAGHSRIPVYEGSRDRIVGLIYAKDVLEALHAQELRARTARAEDAASGSSGGSAGAGASAGAAAGVSAAAGAPASAPVVGKAAAASGGGPAAGAAAAGATASGVAAGPRRSGRHRARVEPGPTLRSLLRKPYFVPATKSVAELLKEFRARKVHMAVVLDEYGGTAGLVTIEDILEEIVGEIADEYDDLELPPIRRLDAHTAEVDAKVHVAELNEELGIHLPEDGEFETLGGFVMFSLGKVPAAGEAFLRDSVRFTVIHADERRVSRVRVEMLQPA